MVVPSSLHTIPKRRLTNRAKATASLSSMQTKSPLEEVLRASACQMLKVALEAEVLSQDDVDLRHSGESLSQLHDHA